MSFLAHVAKRLFGNETMTLRVYPDGSALLTIEASGRPSTRDTLSADEDALGVAISDEVKEWCDRELAAGRRLCR